jgi:hypothetical protein
MQHTRTRALRRIALTAAAVTLAIAAPAAAAQAHSGRSATPAHTTHDTVSSAESRAAAPIRAGDPQSTVDRVGDFYGAYIDAVWDGGNDPLAQDLRAHYLTPGLQTELAAWEESNHADGVLRAQDVPQGWQVTSDGSGAGHAFTVVRLQWGNPAHPDYTYLKVQSDLATTKISDIQEQ